MTLEYDGGRFSGFQVQPNKATVQGDIEKALSVLTGERIRIRGAGRTDAGVHALAQTVNFRTGSKLSVHELKRALNSILRNIRVTGISVAVKTFDSRGSAKSREYEYLIFNGEVLPVFLEGRALHVKGKLDLKAMKKASKALVGKHDFSSFCLKDADDRGMRKHLKRLEIKVRTFKVPGYAGGLICIRAVADGFLWKMVRFIVGTLLRVGRGKIAPAEIKGILRRKNNRFAGPVAPACGLYLTSVRY